MRYEPKLKEHIERPAGHGYREDHRERRVGVMLHYDGSTTDTGSVDWFRDARAKYAGYHYLVLDDGRYVTMGPYEARMYHAGKCKPHSGGPTYRDANSAFIGISVAATKAQAATAVQQLAVAALCRKVFQREGWSKDDLWRITTHEAEAWARGRKHDPTGPTPKRPVMDPEMIKILFQLL